jgi:hypothetical protein
VVLRRGPRAASDRRSRLVALVLGWPVGLAHVFWRYLWRTTPMHRSEVDGDAADLPGPVPASVHDSDVQAAADGIGPLWHRRFTVVVDGVDATPERIFAPLARDPNWAVPDDLAVFEKTHGRTGVLAVGDEFVVRMPGPWDGPVRVVACGPTSFRLATLRGHLEAGQIEFRARGVDGDLHMEIEAWARAGDRLAHLLYNHLRLAKEIQLNLWIETCLRVALRHGGRARGGVWVRTRRVADPAV